MPKILRGERPGPSAELLCVLRERIDAAKSEALEARARTGIELNRSLKRLRQTPEVQALRRRVYVELFDMNDQPAP